jgi:hypothetical protein
MANTADIQLDARFFCLFKGDPGVGKSIAAASFPKPFIFDNDRRIKSVVNYWRPRGKEVDYMHAKDFIQIQQKLESFLCNCPYETIVYDGFTTGADMILRTMQTTRETGAKKIMRGGIELLQIEDYGGESQGLKWIIETLKDISWRQNVHVICTAHVLETSSTNLKTQQSTISRSLMTAGKKIAAALPVHFDEAYHFDVQSGFDPTDMPKYTILTHHVGQDWAKTALPLPMRIDFTNGSLYDKIMEELTAQGVRTVKHLEEPRELPPEAEGGW